MGKLGGQRLGGHGPALRHPAPTHEGYEIHLLTPQLLGYLSLLSHGFHFTSSFSIFHHKHVWILLS